MEFPLLSCCATEMGVRGQEVPTPLVCAQLEQSPPSLNQKGSLKLCMRAGGDFTEPDAVPRSGSTFPRCVLLSPFTPEETGSEDGDGVGHALRSLGAWTLKCLNAAGVGDTAETSQLF